jgi:hypothetical protein
MGKTPDNLKDKTAQDTKTSLDDNDLENVSGGFTIIDTCQNRWSPGICNAIWGACPHLSISQTDEKCSFHNSYADYLVSCDKGCFVNITYREHFD